MEQKKTLEFADKNSEEKNTFYAFQHTLHFFIFSNNKNIMRQLNAGSAAISRAIFT